MIIDGWWLGHHSEKYDFVNWDDDINPSHMGKCQKWQPNHQPALYCLYVSVIFRLCTHKKTTFPLGRLAWKRSYEMFAAMITFALYEYPIYTASNT